MIDSIHSMFRRLMINIYIYASTRTIEMLHTLMGLYTDKNDLCYDNAYAPYHCIYS